MPVDPQFVDFKKIKGGKERLVLPNGEVVAEKDARRKKRMATVTFLISQHARGTEDKTEKYSLGGNKNGKI